MTKHDAPPFRMKVDRGRLVPATPYDAERLDTYRNGTEVNVRFTRAKQRVGEIVWHASINRAVKQCRTPWKTAEEASEAIKLSLGIVHLAKTVGGAWMHYPKSLTELTEPELDEAVEDLFRVLYGVTGVDPDSWREQAAAQKRETSGGPEIPAGPAIALDGHAIEQEPASNGKPLSIDAVGHGDTPPCAAVAVHTVEGHTIDGSTAAGDAPAATKSRDGPGSSPAADLKSQMVGSLRQECMNKLLVLASDRALAVEERAAAIENVRPAWLETLFGEPDFLRAVFKTALQVARGELALCQARKYLDGIA